MPLIQVGGHYRRGKEKVEPLFAEIDEEDVERVSQYCWSKLKHGHTTYAMRRADGQYLHRFIMGLDDYKEDKRIINHKDGNGLNNKKENLEICDIMYNSQSFRRHHGERGVGCVYYRKNGSGVKRWTARIYINTKRFEKWFLTEQEGRDWIASIVSTHT